MDQVAPAKRFIYHGGLRELADAYSDVQRARLGMEARKLATLTPEASGTKASDDLSLWSNVEAALLHEERLLGARIAEAVTQHPVGPWITAIPGVGSVVAGTIIGYIVDGRRFGTISKLWRYCGYGVIDGRAERRKKGAKSHFVPTLKAALHVAGLGMIRNSAGYRSLYVSAEIRYIKERPGWIVCRTCGTTADGCRNPSSHERDGRSGSTRGWNIARVTQAARRRMVKVFLSNLWVVWHVTTDTPVPRRPYVHDVLGHDTYHGPEEFVDFPLPPIVYMPDAKPINL